MPGGKESRKARNFFGLPRPGVLAKDRGDWAVESAVPDLLLAPAVRTELRRLLKTLGFTLGAITHHQPGIGASPAIFAVVSGGFAGWVVAPRFASFGTFARAAE